MDRPQPLPSQNGPNFDIGLGAPDPEPPVRVFQYGEYYHLHPNVKKRWQIGLYISTLTFLGILAAATVFMVYFLHWWVQVAVPIAAGLVLASLILGLRLVSFQYRRWRFCISRDEFTAERGVIIRRKTTIPRLRIQHVDIDSGPIDRMFGLVELSLYTAGAVGAIITIPGLTPDDAEALRIELLHLK